MGYTELSTGPPGKRKFFNRKNGKQKFITQFPKTKIMHGFELKFCANRKNIHVVTNLNMFSGNIFILECNVWIGMFVQHDVRIKG